MTTTTENCCESSAARLERARYYPRQLMTAETMQVEQDYFREKLRRHNRYLYGFGVACGFDVKPHESEDQPWSVRICPGYALGPQGDEILLCEKVVYDLATGQQTGDPCADAYPCPNTGAMPGNDQDTTVYLAIRYAECPTRPERVPATGCSCDESACEYSRTRDSYELKLLWELPSSHKLALEWEQAWCEKVGSSEQTRTPGSPVPACPPCYEDPWVVLATIRLPGSLTDPITSDRISYVHRQPLYGARSLRLLLSCSE